VSVVGQENSTRAVVESIYSTILQPRAAVSQAIEAASLWIATVLPTSAAVNVPVPIVATARDFGHRGM